MKKLLILCLLASFGLNAQNAAKHIYPEWEAPKCHQFCTEFKQEMKSVKPDVYLVGEVWANANIFAPYFKSLNSNFDSKFNW